MGNNSKTERNASDAKEQSAHGSLSSIALPRRPAGARVPLSFSQRQLWFIQQMIPNTPAYNVPWALKLEREVDITVLQRAANEIIRRHEALRTRFGASDGEPVQLIEPELHITIEREDLSGISVEERQGILRRRLGEEGRKPFKLERLPLLRIRLFQLGGEQVLLTVVHHILFDGWSLEIFYRELEALYTAYRQGESSPLPEFSIQYSDYAYWQAESLRQGELEEGIEYWKKQLTGTPWSLELPADYPRPVTPRFEGASIDFEISEPVTRSLKELSRKSGVTLYMTLLAAYAVLLQRYTRQEQILIGTPIANRSLEELQRLIGFFANTLVMRVDLRGNVRFTELLKRVRESALGGYAHQDVPFELLVERLKPERSLNRTPLFQTMFVMQSSSHLSGGGFLSGYAVNTDLPVAKFDLSLSMRERHGKLSAEFNYDISLFAADTIRRLQNNFIFLLEELSKAGPLRLSDLTSMLSSGERDEIRHWNSTDVCYGRGERLHVLFEKQVQAAPERLALVCEQGNLTYREVNRRANQLAHYLQKQGVGPELCVGVCMERSWEMVVALLGILKTGAAYLPLDPEYPTERLHWMQHDARVNVVLTQEKFSHRLDRSKGTRVIPLDTSWSFVSQERDHDCLASVSGENVAYVIYTSGSTGKPKGVMNRHRGICNRLLWMQQAYRLHESDRILQKTPYSFDVSVWEFFWPLIAGARLVIARPGGHRDSTYLRDVIKKEGITTIHFVPSMLKSMLEDEGLRGCRSLRSVICSGEALGLGLKEQFYRQCQAGLHNLYGPTEAAVDVTFWECERETTRSAVPIGRPISNTQIYLLDQNLMEVPVLATAELCIGGEGLSRGYLNRPDLTAEKFLPNPFGEKGTRLYRTGDLARFLNDGAVEYLGRMDNQVKVRGNRIELGEIEEVLKQHALVQDGAVIAHEETGGEKRLIAYIATKKDVSVRAQDLRAYLKDRLPDFMIPGAFVFVEKMPLSSNGKLDRKALTQLEAAHLQESRSYIAPRNILEDKIAQIWAKVLQVEQVGVDDHFFDLGGHSLRLMQVHSELKQKLQIDIPVIDLFRVPTVSALANYITAVKDVTKSGEPTANFRTQAEDTSIAVIGMAGRFPGARNIEEFWENIKNGVESVSFFSDEELSDVPDAVRGDPNFVKAAAVLEDADFFDADFFGFRRREAETTDPQQRVFLECAWEVLERAGYDSERYPGAIGVFAGMATSSYWFNLCRNPEVLESVNSFQLTIGNDKDHLPLRVSYKLNLKGPSISVQTACSSSLVAVHLACQSLLDGECKMAMAGGVSIRAVQKTGYVYQEGGISSPDGHCRAFDADAAGTISGNGAAVVLLKKLKDAIADGDHIHAIVVGSAINNDGAFKIGYTAPSIDGQADVIARAQARAGVPADTITYVEAHGTATPLGDPIEVAALTQAFRLQTNKTQFCAIGSVKTNIGHLDAAAGIAGFIKAVLALESGLLPPSLNFRKPNPKIDFCASPFFVNSRFQKWECASGPRRAGVSSFGIGGTNAHAVLEEAPQQEPDNRESQPQLLLLSCRSDAALQKTTLKLAEHLKSHPEQCILDVAYTLQEGRREFAFRRAILCQSSADGIRAMESGDTQRIITGKSETASLPVYFLFPGQGAQYVNMTRGLYESIPVFRREVDRCSEILRLQLGFHLETLLYPGEGSPEDLEEKMRQTANAQPTLFVIEYALASLWMELGIRPQAMLGHSLGEYVAACMAGVMSLEDALRLVTVRGQLMQNMPPGAMLTVAMPHHRVAELLSNHKDVALAAVNAEESCVVSGSEEAIVRLETQLVEQGFEPQRLRTSHAFHSPMMTPVAESLRHVLTGIKFKSPCIPFLSNLTGGWITPEQASSAEYWIKHLLHTVRFSDNLRHLLKEPGGTLLEMGPATLTVLAKRYPERRSETRLLASIKSRAEKESEYLSFLHSVGTLWADGRQLLWHILPRHGKCKRVILPTYPFERQRYNVPIPAQTIQSSVTESTAESAPGPTFFGNVEAAFIATCKPRAQCGDNGKWQDEQASTLSAQQLVLQQLDVVARQLELLRKRVP